MKKLILSLFIITMLLSACKRETSNPDPLTPASMEDLVINSDFDWKTTKDYQLTLKGSTNNIVEIQSGEGTMYLSIFIEANTPSIMKLTVPSYADSIYLVYQGDKVGLELKSENLSYTFN